MQQALESGQVTQKGTTTVNSTPAIAVPRRMQDAQSVHLTLDVDARTYQPLRTVTVVDGNPRPHVAGRAGPYSACQVSPSVEPEVMDTIPVPGISIGTELNLLNYPGNTTTQLTTQWSCKPSLCRDAV